ncbi:ABC transporter permease subunit [Sphaerisporangium viridialbum]|uniref:ABC transporter permease subunit n=1 Tax=Sphaerisporangium viridialbum TaxID=46189 RepID=UPI003C7457F7
MAARRCGSPNSTTRAAGTGTPPASTPATSAPYIYAVGLNPESARLAGVPVRTVTISVYMISGLLAGLGGVLLTSRLGADIPTAGTGFELSAIAACVIGGAGLFGAKGSAIGPATGALIMGVLNNGGNLLAINTFYLQIAIGVLIFVAVGLDQLNTMRRPQAAAEKASSRAALLAALVGGRRRHPVESRSAVQPKLACGALVPSGTRTGPDALGRMSKSKIAVGR